MFLPFPGIDLKKASKLFAQKFATGSSVTKNPQGQEDITVQGDVTDEIVRSSHSRFFSDSSFLVLYILC